jgi:hypothetical protein
VNVTQTLVFCEEEETASDDQELLRDISCEFVSVRYYLELLSIPRQEKWIKVFLFKLQYGATLEQVCL